VLKLKEVGIVLAWIIGVCLVVWGMYKGVKWLESNNKMIYILYYLGFLLGALIYAILHVPFIYWLKSNWKKAGEIEERTRKKK
jgi:cytosine/uracil/thiamine/allantoin permease